MSDQGSSKKNSVKVTIMQRDFTVACSEDEKAGLLEAAEHMDKQMRAIAKGSQILGMDRMAIMAGLNISHELLQLRKSMGDDQKIQLKIKSLHDKVDQAIQDIQQVGL